jgi:RNA polymerase sigma factor (sigma-70 family)
MNRGKLSPEDVRQLYEQYGRALLAYAYAIVSGRAAAEDVLHQVFEKLLRGNTEISGSESTYLYRAVRNAALNHLRNRSREVALSNGAWLESPKGLETDGVALQSALRDLPEEQREIIVLHIWGQMSFDEAAAVSDISPKTAASRYRYGLAKLREKLKPIE